MAFDSVGDRGIFQKMTKYSFDPPPPLPEEIMDLPVIVAAFTPTSECHGT